VSKDHLKQPEKRYCTSHIIIDIFDLTLASRNFKCISFICIIYRNCWVWITPWYKTIWV